MPRINNNSRGATLAAKLQRGRQQAERAARPGARTLPVIRGVTTRCEFFIPQENVLAQIGEIFVAGQRLFRYGNSIYLEVCEGTEKRLVQVHMEGDVATKASSMLANLVVCEIPPSSEDGAPLQFPAPQKLIALALNCEPIIATLPRVKQYATRPVFNDDFVLCGPGWHVDSGILVHGPDVAAAPFVPCPAEETALARLPVHLRQLLSDFAFRSDADVANAAALFLTGLLVGRFVASGKPIALLDGNQPRVGKTRFVEVVGIVLDGEEPTIVPFKSDDDELAKAICAKLNTRTQSIVLIDNAKIASGGTINSPTIEAFSTAPMFSMRILGQSKNFERPNDLIWCVTMNNTRGSADLVARSMPVRFHFEGDPSHRDYGGRDPKEYARRHRVDLLGELVGMIDHWNRLGRPPGVARHSLTKWAEIIGGIMVSIGFPEFLTNSDEAAAEFNDSLGELAALAEAAIAMRSTAVIVVTETASGA